MKPQRLRSQAFMARAMDAWADTVYRIALSHMRSVPDAEDITQDVFVKLLKSTTVFEDENHLKAWLVSMTLNRCREVQRTAERRRTAPTEKVPDTRMPPRPTKESSRVRARSGRRSALHLRYVEGYSAEEIADM